MAQILRVLISRGPEAARSTHISERGRVEGKRNASAAINWPIYHATIRCFFSLHALGWTRGRWTYGEWMDTASPFIRSESNATPRDLFQMYCRLFLRIHLSLRVFAALIEMLLQQENQRSFAFAGWMEKSDTCWGHRPDEISSEVVRPGVYRLDQINPSVFVCASVAHIKLDAIVIYKDAWTRSGLVDAK